MSFLDAALARGEAPSRSCSRSGPTRRASIGTAISTGAPTAGGSRSPSVDGRISVWDTTNGTLLVNLPQKPHAFQAAFTPHGSLLVTAGNTGIPSFWDTRTWKLVARPAQGHGSADRRHERRSRRPHLGDCRQRRRGRRPLGRRLAPAQIGTALTGERKTAPIRTFLLFPGRTPSARGLAGRPLHGLGRRSGVVEAPCVQHCGAEPVTGRVA